MDLIIPTAVGAAGNLIAEVGKRGSEWLIEKYRSHNPAVQKQAQTNANNFIYRLAQRVDRLEKELPVSQQSLINQAFEHPGTSLLIQKSLITAAATDNEVRHELLTELIAQRLTADPEDNIALAGSAACEVIGALSSRQIKILGVMARLYDIVPLETPEFTNQDEYDQYLISYWSSLSNLSQGLENMTGFDLRHLEGLSCVRIIFGQTNITNLLKKPFPSNFSPTIKKFELLEWWSRIQHIMKIGVSQAQLSSVGLLIGVLNNEITFKIKIKINFGK